MFDNVSSICEGLNREQTEAVHSVEGPVLIVAGAGSGKTRVLTCRLANILARGCDPERILALTFTKKAAGEMKDRVASMVGVRKARMVCMGTFHAVFVRFLRDYADKLSYPHDFTIYDTSDSTSAIKACIKELQLDDKVYKPREVLSRISMAKNNLVTEQAYRNSPNILASDAHSRKPRICDIYSLYVKKCKAAGVMDFDDILLNMNILFRDCPDALAEISERFSYIMVDEYQDTNYSQYLILHKLAQTHHNICVVGDDSQSIYAFRGAKIENIFKFKDDYPGCKLIRLERNYRSTKSIVSAANSVIAKNQGRIPKECYSEGDFGEKIKLVCAYSEADEAMEIVFGILEGMRKYKAQYQDFAILYRTNSQSRAIEEALRRRNIPYQVYSGNSFFERSEVKDMMAYFKLSVNPNDEESFKRIVNKPTRGIGDTSLNALETAAREKNICLFKAAYEPDLGRFGLKTAAIQRVRAFCDMISSFCEASKVADAHDLAMRIATDSGLYAYYKSDTSIEGLSRTANVEELLNSVEQFVEDKLMEDREDGSNAELDLVTLGEFLEEISLLSNVDISDDEDASNKVALMTVHSAKGLEFPYVFVAGMEENLFPSGGMMISPAELEEERRLFYVALTRAMKAVNLTYAKTRMRNGRHESNPPSRFLREIDSRYVQNPLPAKPNFDEDEERDEDGRTSPFWPHKKNFTAVPSSYTTDRGQRPEPFKGYAAVKSRPLPDKIPDSEFVPTPMKQLKVSDKVEHNRFGKGVIQDISGTYPELKAKIAFDDFGEKFIMLKYAKLRLLK